MITIEYICSTDYLTPLNITVIVSAGNKTLHQHTIVCSTGRLLVNSSLNQCGQGINVSGYWILTDVNETMSTCSLSNYSISLPCPTMSPTSNPGTYLHLLLFNIIIKKYLHFLGIIVRAVILILIIIIIVITVISFLVYKYNYKLLRNPLSNTNVQQSSQRGMITD